MNRLLCGCLTIVLSATISAGQVKVRPYVITGMVKDIRAGKPTDCTAEYVDRTTIRLHCPGNLLLRQGLKDIPIKIDIINNQLPLAIGDTVSCLVDSTTGHLLGIMFVASRTTPRK